MARPIKETPILIGKDAREFEKEITENETKQATKEEYERAIKALDQLQMLD
jgi:hypothetical protein